MSLPKPKKVPVWRKLLPLIGFLLLAWILSRLDGDATRAAFTSVTLTTVLLSCLWFMVNLVIKGLRWWRLLVAQRRALPWPVALAAFMAGQFYGQVTLGRLGEFYRAEPLIERGVPAGEALSSCVVDRLFDIFIVLLLGAVLGAVVAGNTAVAVVSAVVMGVGLGLVAGAVYLQRTGSARPGVREWFVARLSPLGRWPLAVRLGRVAEDMVFGTLALLRGRTVVETGLWTALSWLGYYAALWALADGMGLPLDRSTLTAAASLAALSGLLPVTVSGLGARELIYQQVLAARGIPPEQAVVLALLHLAVMSGSAVVFGGLGVWARGRQRVRDGAAAGGPI